MKINSINNQLISVRNFLNGDRKLNFLEKILWLLLNFLNNNTVPKNPNYKKYEFIKKFSPKYNDKDINSLLIGKSPSRTIGNLFWKKLNWQLIKRELGEINIFDTGCGAGDYGIMINKFSNGIKSYFGIDFYPRKDWNKTMKDNPFIVLKRSSSSNIRNLIPSNTNLIITQSAIEHFRYDLQYFHQIKEFINKTNKNILQIHLFPSPACLWLYLFHGYRQYNLYNIKKIIKIFEDDKNYCALFPLGGNKLNNLHLKFITLPSLFKKKLNLRSQLYNELLKKYLKYEIKNKTNFNPSFYALVIHSNFRNKVI